MNRKGRRGAAEGMNDQDAFDMLILSESAGGREESDQESSSDNCRGRSDARVRTSGVAGRFDGLTYRFIVV